MQSPIRALLYGIAIWFLNASGCRSAQRRLATPEALRHE
jgi:hypothetical protein